MMKFFTKKILSIVSIALAVIVVGVTWASVMLSSKSTYDEYYKQAIAEKEQKKYLNSLPLELKGISAELAEGKEYFTDGLASPKNEDLVVTAHFTEKGKDFDKYLRSDAYDMTVAEDFAEKGGKIGVSYTFIPEKKNETDPDPEPTVKTAEVEVKLTKVALKELRLEKTPYRIYYSDAMKFDTDGMSCIAVYNNGREAVVPADKLAVESNGNLKAGAETATVSYTLEDVKKTLEVPVTVVKAADYTDGEVLSIVADGESVSVKEGAMLSSVTLPVRATYDNGNRLLLKDGDYTVTGNTEKATFANNCVLTCALKENASVVCKTAAKVVYEKEAEETTVTGAEIAEENGVKAVKNFADNAKLSFKVNSSSLAKGKFTVRIKNLASEEVNLGDALSLTVNGASYYVSKTLKAAGGADYAYYTLPSTVLYTGDNAISLSVKAGAKIAIDKFLYETRYEGSFYSSVGEYIANNETPNLSVTKAVEWNNVQKAYMHGICSDERYIYGACTGWSAGKRAILVKKYDPETGSLIAFSAPTAAESSEDFAGIAYIDGKVITFMSDGTKYCIDSSLTGSWEEYKGISFKDYENTPIYDAAYVAKNQTYVLRTSAGQATLFNKAGEKKGVVSFDSEAGCFLKRISVSGDYIYAVYSNNGKYQPIVRAYDYSGKLVRRFVVSYDLTGVLGTVITNPANTNVQGMVVINDSIYFSVLKFSTANGGDQHAILKADYPEITDKLEVKLTYGEYVAATAAAGKTGTVKATCATTSLDVFAKTIPGYSMGIASDGKYFYLATNGGGNTTAVMYKVDPATYEVVARTTTFTTGTEEAGDNARLFIKDGVLYCIPSAQKPDVLYGVKLDEFVGTAVKPTEYKFPLDGVSTAKSVVYNESAGRYAFCEWQTESNGWGSALNIYGADGKAIKTGIALGYTGMKASAVTADDKYVYVSYCVNNQAEVPVDVFDWDGNKVATMSFTGVSLGMNGATPYNFNVQAITVINGDIYASVCTWDGGKSYYYIFKTNVDMSVFD